MKYKTH